MNKVELVFVSLLAIETILKDYSFEFLLLILKVRQIN